MSWKKLGLVWEPKKDMWWNQSYGQLPVPQYLKSKSRIRIYFGSADSEVRCRINYIEVCEKNPAKILYENSEPIVELGDLGCFDDNGVVPSSIIEHNNTLFLYTVGYQLSKNVPYMLFAGLVKSENGGKSFERVSRAPILPRSNLRPTSQGAPCVIFEDGLFKMWHWYSTKWIDINGKLFLNYRIGYAESLDAINWDMKDLVCISPNREKKEFAVARPWVIREGGIYKMWYSIRYTDKMYRMGYAESLNGLNWIRKDYNAGLDISPSGWDSEMICYPSICKVNNKKYMFYNGNDNGKTGFGVAVWCDD